MSSAPGAPRSLERLCSPFWTLACHESKPGGPAGGRAWRRAKVPWPPPPAPRLSCLDNRGGLRGRQPSGAAWTTQRAQLKASVPLEDLACAESKQPLPLSLLSLTLSPSLLSLSAPPSLPTHGLPHPAPGWLQRLQGRAWVPPGHKGGRKQLGHVCQT